MSWIHIAHTRGRQTLSLTTQTMFCRTLRFAAVSPARFLRPVVPLATRQVRQLPLLARKYSTDLEKPPAVDPATAASDLLSTLRNEQKVESESFAEDSAETVNFQEHFNRFGFDIVEKDGNEEIQLVRKLDNETIRVYFSISDVVNSDTILDEAEEEIEESETPREEEETENFEFKDDFEAPIRLNIIVEKPAGALGIEAVAQDDMVIVESIIPYASAALAVDESPQADYERRQKYQGPPFSVLDPSVQAGVQQFLESRGIDGDFALLIAEYANFRENKEYIAWLGRLADIIAS